MKICFFALVFVFAAIHLFPSGKKDTKRAAQNVPVESVENNITKIKGRVQIYGSEPHTFVGIVDQNDIAYAVYPPSQEEKLRALQGRLIEFSVVFLDGNRTFGSLFLRGGTVEPVKWEILE